MTKFENRIKRLEQQISDQRSELIEQPRVAGKPLEVAISERIEWLRKLLVHPAVGEKQRQQIRERAECLTKIWSNLTHHSTSAALQREADDV